MATASSRAQRPRTFADARAMASSSSELGWWVFMRISGLLLVPLAFGHLWANNMAFNAGEIDFAYVAGRLAQPGVKIFDSFLLLFAMLHGVNGLRYSIEDYVKRPGRRFAWKMVLFTVAGIVFVLGVMTLWAFSFEEMGDAVRALGAE
ncbi:MAG: succinate dehydrogenase, hydrophobic membrane anchor protein [Trueperaceae bacterium]|nr:MAG: succinate dehydrogenase, hydrophobic membrane anchor protein [Trueperaceae bacterium]